MKTIKQLTILLILILLSFVSVSQTNTDYQLKDFTDPDNTQTLTVRNSLDFDSFLINPDSNIEISKEDAIRDYYNQNYYFKFRMPSSKDVNIFIKYPDNNNLTCGFASYSSNSGQFEFTDLTRIKSSPGVFRVNNADFNPGEIVRIRFWFSRAISDTTLQIGLKKTDPVSVPKLISVDQTTYTTQQLVQDILISGCLQAFNVTYNGDPVSIGYFTGNIGTSGFNEGIIMTSGDANLAIGPDNSTSAGHTSTGGSDTDLQSLIPSFTVNDAAVLEFDFIPASDTLKFDYIFGSEEFPEWANSSYNDVFGFFLSGPGINGPYSNNAVNIALLPNGQPVTIDNLFNSGIYYTGANTGSGGTGLAYNNDIEYDGASVPLTAEYQVQQCQQYHIKLAIGDAGDSSYDSGVFLKAGSFTSGQQYTVSIFNSWFQTSEMYESCETHIVFTRTDSSSLNQPISIPLNVSGTATMGTDYSNVPDTFNINPGIYQDTLTISAFADGIIEGMETIIFTYMDGCPCTQSTNTDTIKIYDELTPNYNLQNSGPICLGDTAILNFNLQPGIDSSLIEWTWLFNGSNDTTTEATPTTNTDYYVEIVYPCQRDTIQTTVQVVPPPVVNLGPNLTVTGLSTVLDANPAGGNSGYWSMINGPGNATIADSLNPDSPVSVDTSGVYYFVWTEISLPPDCQSSDTIAIDFLHIPSPDFTVSPIDCYGDTITVTYTGSAYSWADYYWNFGSATVISGSGEGPYEIVYTTPGSHTISLDIDELGVMVDTAITFSTPPELVYTLQTNDDPCYQSCNGSAQVNVQGGTPPYNYSWSSGSPQLNNVCAGNYDIIITDDNGCTTGESFTISEPPELVYDTSKTDIDCYGNNTGTAEINPSGGTPPYTYIWSNGNNGSQINNLYTGPYSVTVIDDNSCEISESFNITQPPELNISFNQDMSICEGEQVNLQIGTNGGTPPYTYYWNEGNGFNPASNSMLVSPNQTTNYTVYIEDANGCKSPYRNMELTVSPDMTIDLTTQDNSCYGECDGSAYIDMTGGLPPFDYSWNAPGSYFQNICEGLYDVTVTDKIGCTTDTVFSITEPDSVTYETNSTPASCAGVDDGTATISNINGGVTPYSYQWSNGSNSNSITEGKGTYSFTITDANNCHSYGEIDISAPQAIDVIPGQDKTICISNSTTITADAMGGTSPYTFNWMGEDSVTGNDHVLTVNPEESTTYFLTITDDNGCTGSGEVNVNVRPPLSIDYIYPNSDTVCKNKAVNVFVIASGGDGGPYTLTINENQISPSPFTISPDESGWWHVELRDNCGTPPVEDSVYITVNDLPDSRFTADVTEGCPPLKVQFSPLEPDFSYTYNWNFGDNDVGFYQNPLHTYNESGRFDVTLSVIDDNGCMKSTTNHDMIEVYPAPEAGFFTEPEYKTILNPSVQFIPQTENVNSVFWYFGDGDSSTWNIEKPLHVYPGVGEYEARLISKNHYGCTDTAVQIITINEHPTFYSPDAFTPNGDGDNDCFSICGKEIDPNDFYLAVYNRWGEKVFETNYYDPDSDCSSCGKGTWDGTMSGEAKSGDNYLPTGQYFWYCKYKDPYGNYTEKDGVVKLIR